MRKYQILWADDEIDLLKPHLLFLDEKGYEVTPVISGNDALDQLKENSYDLVFLDENMPGKTGLETLQEIKTENPALPIVMITKSEAEEIMEDAIGSKIDDYLIKPLKPSQILLSVKKILDNKRLVTEKVTKSYRQEFDELSQRYNKSNDWREWIDIYRKLVYWELEIDRTTNKAMAEVVENQKEEAGNNFAKFLSQHYQSWFTESGADAPLLSHQLMRRKVFKKVERSQEPVFFIVIDNLRMDQWKVLEQEIAEFFHVLEEDTYYAILPTTTAYARNAIFSGLMPLDLSQKYPEYWVEDNNEEEGKNNYEAELLQTQLQMCRLQGKIKAEYHKILNTNQGKHVVEQFDNLCNNDLVALVYNFVDMLSHARTDSKMIRELAPDESAYRSITRSWFLYSPLYDMLKKIAESGYKVIITTDHGTMRVKRPYKIVGNRAVNTNLRYKQGKNLGYDEGGVYVSRNPEKIKLPKNHVSSAYVFATRDYFFAYPNNYNYYVKYFTDTFQHGGVSLEEVIVPVVTLQGK